jgi:hypothetical protein
MARLSALAALFGLGLLLAVALPTVGSADTTTETTTQTTVSTEQVTTTVEETTTAPATTVVTTVAPTTAPTTTSTESASSGTPTWVWILVAVLGAALIGLLVYVLTQGGSAVMPANERQLRLQGAIDSWAAQGWALISESADTAVLQRGNERMTVTVDPAGHINTRAMTPPPPAPPPDRWPE